jgi:hypothetical protein
VRPTEGILAVTPSGEDPSDRVRPLRSGAPLGGSENRPSTFWASPSSAEQAAADNSRSNGKPDATACGRSSRKLRRRCDSDGITRSPNRGITHGEHRTERKRARIRSSPTRMTLGGIKQSLGVMRGFPPSCACRTTVLARILTTQRPDRPSLAALAGLARCKPWSWRGGVGAASGRPTMIHGEGRTARPPRVLTDERG